MFKYRIVWDSWEDLRVWLFFLRTGTFFILDKRLKQLGRIKEKRQTISENGYRLFSILLSETSEQHRDLSY